MTRSETIHNPYVMSAKESQAEKSAPWRRERVTTWIGFQEIIEPFLTGGYLFRGVGSARFGLIPSVGREQSSSDAGIYVVKRPRVTEATSEPLSQKLEDPESFLYPGYVTPRLVSQRGVFTVPADNGVIEFKTVAFGAFTVGAVVAQDKLSLSLTSQT